MNCLVPRKYKTQYFDTINRDSYINLAKCLISYMKEIDLINRTPVILCIGTDRATGDCLGPLVGENLINFSSRYKVMGCLSSPIHALNIKEAIYHIKNDIENPFIIAIDAALGERSHIGRITISTSPISPGRGVNKKLPAIGDISITGIVNVISQNPGLLQSTRLHTVMQLSNCITEALKYSINYFDDF